MIIPMSMVSMASLWNRNFTQTRLDEIITNLRYYQGKGRGGGIVKEREKRNFTTWSE